MSNQTKLPLLPVLVAATIMFCNTFMNTVLLPFLSFMIDDFHVAPNHDDIGTYSGYLVASFMLGQLIFSYSWGLASDRLGRRPILLVGLFLTAFSFLAFGFSTTYPMAIALRSLNGSVNGIVGVCKTFLSEITDNSNQGQGFSIFGVARGLGMIVGPVVGGYLSNPHTKYPKWFPKDSLFYTFPYALPTVIGCIIALSATIIGYFVLEETNQLVLRKNQMSNDSETAPLLLNQDQSMDQVEVEDNVDTHTHGNGDKGLLNVLDKATSLTSPNDNNSDDLLTGSTDLTKSTHDLNDLAIHTGSDDDRLDQSSVCTVDSLTVEHHTNHLVTTISTTDNIVNPSTLNNHSSINTSATASIETQPNASIIVSNTTPNSSTLQPLPKNLTTYQLIMTKRVFYSLILYGSVAFLYIQYDELFALWSRLPFEEGGLDFNSADQGFAFAIAGVALFVYQMFFFSRIERYLGILRTFQTGILISIPAFIILPLTNKIVNHFNHDNDYLLWTLIGLCHILRTVGGVQAITITFIMISNSVTSRYRGQVNGIGQTVGSIGRMTGPIFGGSLFSWSLENESGFPFDYHFVFYLLTLLVSLTFMVSFLMPGDIDYRLLEDDDE